MTQDGTFPIQGNPVETAWLKGDVFAADCPTRLLLDRIGDKWSALVLLLLGEEPYRFNELKRRIAGVSQKMLSQTLRMLERDGLVTRHVVATKPVSVSYAITPLGGELIDALRALMAWSEARIGTVLAAQRAFDAREDAAG
ncbi:helix-turn-helix domain-containing protein [uncultured Sphingomonas sp.]|uniref:winged helix-turn-helix transcriptional regulator n=1 Tax=uncultured Sphingomonas sp. TaxID=158754 RepID=UPI0025FBF61A|nr:helix-turn-helix domain-containing protein [uncultured Sphingomonas sp.]